MGWNRNYTFSKVRLSHLVEEAMTSQEAPVLADVKKRVPGPSRGRSRVLVTAASLLRCRMRVQAGGQRGAASVKGPRRVSQGGD